MRAFATNALVVLIAFGIAPRGSAQDITISDVNSSIGLNITNGTFGNAGVTSWVVDGVDQLNRQWLYYRVGPVGAESSIETIGAPVVTGLGANYVEVLYANSSYGVKFSYTLGGNPVGTGKSGATLGINVINYQASPLDFHLFQYSDFDLNGGASPDSVTFLKAVGKFNRAAQTSGAAWMTNTFSGVGIPNPTPKVEAGLNNVSLAGLTDLVASDYASSATNSGPGNVTYAMQWDLSLAAGTGFSLAETISMQVPEPSSFAIIATAIVSFVCSARHRHTKCS